MGDQVRFAAGCGSVFRYAIGRMAQVSPVFLCFTAAGFATAYVISVIVQSALREKVAGQWDRVVRCGTIFG